MGSFVRAAPLLAGLALLPFAGAPSPATRVRADAVAVFAGGCFWGIEAVFEHLRGVRAAVSGYSGGTVANPSYEQVSTGRTGHVEAVQVSYDPERISYRQLLDVFFRVAHDPTTGDRQGPDVGPEYRAVVFYRGPEQQREIESYLAELRAAKVFSDPILTEVRPLTRFYPAETYHQDYAERHPRDPYIVVNDAPKVDRLRRDFGALYRERPRP